jgi:hypothetical protein
MSATKTVMEARAANIRLGQSGPIGPTAYRMENGGRGVAARTSFMSRAAHSAASGGR